MPIPAGSTTGDQLASPADIAAALQAEVTDIHIAAATIWAEACTAVVQAAAGNQRILQVINDSAELTGLTCRWLDLPQIPVTSVASVTLDGTLLTAVQPGGDSAGYRLVGNRLWRTGGWQTYTGEPSLVVVVNTHGYPPGSQDLQLARAAVITLARSAYSNPSGAASEKIDDYAVAYEKAAAAMENMPNLRASLRRKYGRRGGLVRIG